MFNLNDLTDYREGCLNWLYWQTSVLTGFFGNWWITGLETVVLNCWIPLLLSDKQWQVINKKPRNRQSLLISPVVKRQTLHLPGDSNLRRGQEQVWAVCRESGVWLALLRAEGQVLEPETVWLDTELLMVSKVLSIKAKLLVLILIYEMTSNNS